MGRARDELLPGIRSFPIDRWVAFYQPTTDGIELIRFLHGSRDVARVMRESGEAG